MPKTISPRLMRRIFSLFLSLLILSIFFYVPGRLNLLQHSWVLFRWQVLPPKLTDLNISELLGDQLIAFLGIFVFGVVCVSFGLFILKSLGIANKLKLVGIFDWMSFMGTAFLLGQGTLALIFILLGGYARLNLYFVIPILVICFLVGIRSLFVFTKSIPLQPVMS